MSITVEVRGGNLEKAMRVLKKKVQKAGIVKDIRAKQYFSKPSEIKREKAKERAKRNECICGTVNCSTEYSCHTHGY